jgi:hypothetical protein
MPHPRIRRRRLATAVALVAGLVSWSAVAGAEPGFSPVVSVPAPDDASGLGVEIAYQALTCAAVTSCTAVGPGVSTQDQSTGVLPAVVETETAGSWGTPTAIALPAGAAAASATGADLLAVACPAAGDCTAVGGYPTTQKGAEAPMVASSSSGTWSSATALPVPANAAASDKDVTEMAGLQCFGVGTCIASGDYLGQDGLVHGFTDVETAGTWAVGTELTEPSGVTSKLALAVGPMRCTDATDCIVLGDSESSDGSDVAAYTWTETAGTWGGPVTLGSKAEGFLGSDLACPDATTCLVVGADLGTTGVGIQPAADTLHAGTWSGPKRIPFPQLSPLAFAGLLSSIDCDTDAVCEATGLYLGQASDGFLPLPTVVAGAATWSNGSWSTVNFVRLWHPAQSFSEDELDAVSCPSTTACVGLGDSLTLSAGISSRDFATTLSPTRPVELPSPPVGLGGIGIRDGVLATWAPPFDDGGAPVTRYTAIAEPGGRSCTSATDRCALHGLADGHRYHVIVTDRNAFGFSKRAVSGRLLIAGLAPSAPTGVRTEVTKQHVAVSWRPAHALPDEPVTSYRVTASEHRFMRVLRTTSTSCVLGLPPGTYRLSVVAVNASGPSASSRVHTVVVHRSGATASISTARWAPSRSDAASRTGSLAREVVVLERALARDLRRWMHF